MIHTTRWSPDTCKCVIEYEWDDAVEQGVRAHTPVKSVRKCEVHANATAHYNVVLEENQRKNDCVGEIMTRRAEISYEDINWQFDQDRVLHISSDKIMPAIKNSLQTILTNRFGLGKVVID